MSRSSVKPTVRDTSPAVAGVVIFSGGKERTPAARSSSHSAGRSAYVWFSFVPDQGAQPLLPRGRRGILPACQHSLFGTSGDVRGLRRDSMSEVWSLSSLLWLKSCHFCTAPVVLSFIQKQNAGDKSPYLGCYFSKCAVIYQLAGAGVSESKRPE